MDQTVGNYSNPPATRGKYERGRETRAQILEAAVQQFATKGYVGCSVAELAGSADCSKNQLFHHFGSKEDLAIEVVRVALEMWRNLIAAPTAVFTHPMTRLDRIVLTVRQLEDHDWPAMRLLALFTMTSDGLPERLNLALQSAVHEINGLIDGLSHQACNLTPALNLSGGQLSSAVSCLIFSRGASRVAETQLEEAPLTVLLGLELLR